ncbi:glutamine and serine-rich protein 1-like isoform X3 [Portunus trituberculatus]|uniref:glutamine and serine-rich protein 1-like isoform X3 n=1 Tax=Portunus trituberculatus TaxID=210409 RepID=UPI001E1CC7F7|nr:glutamine and serine-rich protein 1-like isoform X3 [Portunus trituberculatus]
MASMSSGMANGTKKPGYISSFMSFLESQDIDDPDDPGAMADTNSASDKEGKGVNVDIKKEESSVTFDPPEDDGLADKEIKVEMEELASADYIPEEVQATDGENTNSSEATSTSESGETSKGGRRNVARRGRRKNGAAQSETRPQRENLRRTSRAVKRYGNTEVESDGLADSDPDFHLSDSDDDPDFNPVDKKTSAASDDEEEKPRRGRGRGRGGTPHRGRGRGIKRTLDKENSASASKSPTTTSTIITTTATTTTTTTTTTGSPPKRRGRPPSYQPVKILPKPTTEGNTRTEGGGQDSVVVMVSEEMNERRGPAQLSSAYNYAGGQVQRQTQNIMVPEGPELTAEQLEMVESQFKSGDFVMAKKDMEMMENPPIWRIDGKSLLQKFQAFEKDGKILYRNISTYSGWTSQAKALYLGVNVTFVFQSRYDTVVQMLGFKPEGEEEESESSKDDASKQTWSNMKTQQMDIEISEELRSHMTSFEIYLQTLISQALDNNFLVEIYEENDEYFVERVKVIDELAEQRKKKVLEIIQWNTQFKDSLDTWPNVNVMVGHTMTDDLCTACSKNKPVKLLQMYGQLYNQQTLCSREALPSESDIKNFNVCDSCSNISQLYNKVAHQKYNYYSECKSEVTNMRVADSKKATTAILQDLLANDHWITKLFRSMCTTWIKVDRLHQDEIERLKKNQQTTSAPATAT